MGMQEVQHDGESEELRSIADDNERLATALDAIQKDLPLEDIQKFFDASKFMTAICAQLSRRNYQIEIYKEQVERIQDDLVKAYSVISGARAQIESWLKESSSDPASNAYENCLELLPDKEPAES